jgi:hypothetical protein
MQKERILWDDLRHDSNLKPVYEADSDNNYCRVRYFDGSKNVWLNYFPNNGQMIGQWISRAFSYTDACLEINKCLEESKYLIVSWRSENHFIGRLSSTGATVITYVSLSIIGLDNLYLGDDYAKVPSWYSDNSTTKVEQEILPPKTIYALLDKDGELCESCYANYQDALAGAVNGSWVCSYNLPEGVKGKD